MLEIVDRMLDALRDGPAGNKQARIYINLFVYDVPEVAVLRWMWQAERPVAMRREYHRLRLHRAVAAVQEVLDQAGVTQRTLATMRAARATHPRLLAMRIEKRPLNCVFCGNDLTVLCQRRGRHRATCSDRCRQALHRTTGPEHPREGAV